MDIKKHKRRKTMLKISFKWAVALAVAASITLSSCGGGGSEATTAPQTQISGIIKSSTGAPISGATVEAAGQSVVTSANGTYTINTGAAASNVVVLVRKTGFVTTAKEVPVASGSTTQVDIAVFADQVRTTYSAAQPANVAVNGANLAIPANAVKTASGADYTGTVSVAASYFSPDTVQGAQAFAGPYTGVDAGVQSSIISMGFMEVKLTDSAGNPLQLKAGSPATLTFPSSSNSANASSVPLWFYDEAAKIWKREGAAARQADGTYQGTVAHFTVWNADFYGVNATLKGCFKNAAGQAVANVGSIGLRTTGWSVIKGGNNPDGNFTILLVPANVSLELYSAVSPTSFTALAIGPLAAGETRNLPCIVASPSTSTTIVNPTTVFTVTGVVTTPPTVTPTTPVNTPTAPVTTPTAPVTTSTTPVTTPTTPVTTPTTPVSTTASFAGSYSGSYSGAEVGTFNVNISSAGVVRGEALSTTFPGLVSNVTGQVSSNGGVTLNSTAGSAGAATFTGTINSTGAVSGTWVYVAPLTGGGSFSGRRN
jgi:Carboxypeptidase regulatory-like domain